VADTWLGRLVELVIDGPDGPEVVQVQGRALTWDPRTGRLWSVRPGRRLARAPSAADRRRVAAFHWSSDGAQLWTADRPAEVGAQRVGELVAITYRCAKDGRTEDWFHPFDRPPQVLRAGGEWVFRGRVVVTDRGIVS
jgi:hypothetical protein